MNFYSEFLDTNISICKTKDGFVAAAELDYVKYTSEPICEGLIANMTIVQFNELHSKFEPEVSFVDQKINVVYDIGFLGAKIMFVLHKENLTSEKEMLIKYKKHSEVISGIENKIQTMQAAKYVSSATHVVKIMYHKKKGMYFEMPDAIKDKFYKLMHTFYDCKIYPQHLYDKSVPWQQEYDSIDKLFAKCNDLYIQTVSGKLWTYLIASSIASAWIPHTYYINKLPEAANFSNAKDCPYKELCDKYNVKELCVSQIYISKFLNYKIYGTDEAEEKKYKIDIIKNDYNIIDNNVYRTQFGMWHNDMFNIMMRPVPTWNEDSKSMQTSTVVWNVQNEPGASC